MNGLEQGKKLNLVGEPEDISQALRLLRFTLMGPTRAELDKWGTEDLLKEEWLSIAQAIALKYENGETIPVEEFFSPKPFVDGVVQVGDLTIAHIDRDHYRVSSDSGEVDVNLNQDFEIQPGYTVQPRLRRLATLPVSSTWKKGTLAFSMILPGTF